MILDPVEGLALGLLSIIFIGCILWVAIKLHKALRTMGEILASQSQPPPPEHPGDGEFHDWNKGDEGRDPK